MHPRLDGVSQPTQPTAGPARYPADPMHHAARVPRSAPVAAVLITLNEERNIEGALRNLKGWASEVFVVDTAMSGHGRSL